MASISLVEYKFKIEYNIMKDRFDIRENEYVPLTRNFKVMQFLKYDVPFAGGSISRDFYNSNSAAITDAAEVHFGLPLLSNQTEYNFDSKKFAKKISGGVGGRVIGGWDFNFSISGE